ncbi:MAG: YbjQ family protein [Planctomycetes bacterium]|nr:YbjQ family protein [Planctomycetota bacterium]
MSQFLTVTTPYLEDRKIVKVLGLVRGNTIRARHVGKDIMAGLRNLVGGEIHEYAKLLAESREQALDRMEEEARALGANAIVGVNFATSVVMGGAAEMLAYGTAVVVEEMEEV